MERTVFFPRSQAPQEPFGPVGELDQERHYQKGIGPDFTEPELPHGSPADWLGLGKISELGETRPADTYPCLAPPPPPAPIVCEPEWAVSPSTNPHPGTPMVVLFLFHREDSLPAVNVPVSFTLTPFMAFPLPTIDHADTHTDSFGFAFIQLSSSVLTRFHVSVAADDSPRPACEPWLLNEVLGFTP